MGCKGCSKRQNNKLNTYDWLCDVPDAEGSTDFVEVQFKNTRKGYYLNSAKIPLEKGDIVAVEASPGHDIGTVYCFAFCCNLCSPYGYFLYLI